MPEETSTPTHRESGITKPGMGFQQTIARFAVAASLRRVILVLDATIIDLGETLDGIFIIGDGTTPDVVVVNGIVTEVECYNQKVWYPGTNTITQWGHNRRLIRYADVLLMAAEALNENDKPGDALPLLNEVRERARGGNGSILPDVTVTEKNALRNSSWRRDGMNWR